MTNVIASVIASPDCDCIVRLRLLASHVASSDCDCARLEMPGVFRELFRILPAFPDCVASQPFRRSSSRILNTELLAVHTKSELLTVRTN